MRLQIGLCLITISRKCELTYTCLHLPISAILGPPRAINVSSDGTMIHISFLPPFEPAENKTEYFEYLIEYWEESTSEIVSTCLCSASQ